MPKTKPYRSDHSDALARIEARRVAAGISVDLLALNAGMSVKTLQRMRKSGMAFKRHVNALAMALRALEREDVDAVLPCD